MDSVDNVDIHSLYCPESPPTPNGNMWIFIDPDVDENKKYPHPFLTFWSQKNVDNVDNQMPSKKSADGEYRDIAHPINSNTRDTIQKTILESYEKALLEPDEEVVS